MRSAVLLLPAAAIALPSPAAPEKALTFNNVQGFAKMYCSPFWNASDDPIDYETPPAGYAWSETVVSLKSGDGTLLVDLTHYVQTKSSYKIDGVPDNLFFGHLQAYKTSKNGLDTLYGSMFSKDGGFAIDITSTPNLQSKDLGLCYKEIAGSNIGKELLLSFQTVTLTPRYWKQ